jgi:hypothetical protein
MATSTVVRHPGIGAYRRDRVPGDAQDDKRDDQADERIPELEADADAEGAPDHREAHEPVGAGMRAVGDQRRALQASPGVRPDLRGDLVADEPDAAGGGECPEVVELLRIEEAVDGGGARDGGATTK